MHETNNSLIAGLAESTAKRLGLPVPTLRAPLALETRHPQLELNTLAFWVAKLLEGSTHERHAARVELVKLIGRGRAMLNAADIIAKTTPARATAPPCDNRCTAVNCDTKLGQPCTFTGARTIR